MSGEHLPAPETREETARFLLDRAAVAASLLCVLVALIPLGSLLYEVARRGVAALSWAFFTAVPAPLGTADGGMAHALLGSLILAALASLPAVPIGVLAGVYVAEYPNQRMAQAVRFSAEVLSGIPSITVGVFVYGLIVLSTRHFSALAGATALAVLMVPTITHTTGELLGRLPRDLREAALALGVSHWRTLTRVLLRAAAPGIAAGVMLSLARVIGDAAPLLFTAFGNDHMPAGLNQPIASIPVQIYTYASSPDEQRRSLAWGAALVLVCLVLALNGGARWLVRRRPS
jgi:phosphate transport system permease protein